MLKETFINNLLIKKYPDIIHNKKISGGCSNRRPDWFIDCITHSVIIECEEMHSSYDQTCENKRTMELFSDLGNRHLVLIRFNPDKTKSCDGCFSYNGDKLLINQSVFDTRMEKLLTTIDSSTECIPDKEIVVYHLYFDR